ECLESLAKINKANFCIEVLVVDNCSNNIELAKLEDFVSSFRSSVFNLSLVKNKRNLGFAGGNNVGLRMAVEKSADYILVLNNDTYVDKNFLKNLIDVGMTDKKIGALSPKIYFARGYEYHKNRYKKKDLGRVIWYAGGDIDWDNVYASNHGVDQIDVGQFDQVCKTDFATGACVLYKTQAILKSGFFDERYFLYLEDTDLSLRIQKNGFKLLYVPSAVIWHKVAQSSRIGSDLNDYYITRNRLLFGFKYANLRAKFALFRESMKFLFFGREWQRRGVIDFYASNFGKGSFKV
ncbi:MAG: glycosyltransferase family 2 protein, partial [Patescibacteria group bacterium]|nr:glycosyltransferase family 2 protein [Patescibacteria group bacterium]